MFCSVLFCSVPFRSVLFCSVLLCSVPFCSVRFCSVMFCSVLFCSVLVGLWIFYIESLRKFCFHLPLVFSDSINMIQPSSLTHDMSQMPLFPFSLLLTSLYVTYLCYFSCMHFGIKFLIGLLCEHSYWSFGCYVGSFIRSSGLRLYPFLRKCL